jgi:hypothetical protein
LDEPAGCLALERVDLESMSNLIPRRAERRLQDGEVDVVGEEICRGGVKSVCFDFELVADVWLGGKSVDLPGRRER